MCRKQQLKSASEFTPHIPWASFLADGASIGYILGVSQDQHSSRGVAMRTMYFVGTPNITCTIFILSFLKIDMDWSIHK